MKQYIEHDETTPFLERFCEFCDSGLASATLQYNARRRPGESGLCDVVLHLITMDSTSQESWVYVALSVEGVTEATIKVTERLTIFSLSEGIHITCFDGRIGVDFSGVGWPPATLEELRKSNGFALGTALAYEVLPCPPEFDWNT